MEKNLRRIKRLKILISVMIIIILVLLYFIYMLYNKNNDLNLVNKELNLRYKKIDDRFKSKYTYDKNISDKLEKLDLDGITKLMIVAHPDDESIFGGYHLMEHGKEYLVVCVTCQPNSEREQEFKKALDSYGAKYLSLAYIDSNSSGVSDWGGKIRYEIYRSLEEIIGYKNWELIITHNPDGEYSHWHHKMCSTIVRDISMSMKLYDNLYYFGKYMEISEAKNSKSEKIPEESLLKKEKIIYSSYLTQYWAAKNLEHIFPYENWIKATDWTDDK